MAPSTIKQWSVHGQNGFDSLKLNDKAPVPELGEKDVLVKRMQCSTSVEWNANYAPVHAASLNYRDLIIPKVRVTHVMLRRTRLVVTQ